MAAPWDTAGLCTQSSLGRNLTAAEAVRCVRKHSLPIQGRDAPLHRQYLASVLERSFAHPDDYWHGVTPVAWYPGWLMPPPRTAQSGSKEEAPHHTFEVRRQGPVPLVDGLLGVVAMDAVLARNSKATRNLERWVRRHAVWEEGKRLHKVDTRRGRTVIRTASDLVERYLNEQGAS